MSRRVERVLVDTSSSGAHTLFTVPTDHKYELLGVFVQPSVAGPKEYDVTISPSEGGTMLIDWFVSDAVTRYGKRYDYNALPIRAGETLNVSNASANSLRIFAWYVDVDFS
jgi:hypothetical protein